MGTGRQAYSRLTDDKRVIYYHQLPASTLSALLLRFAFSAASDGLEPPSSLKHHFQDFLVDNSRRSKNFSTNANIVAAFFQFEISNVFRVGSIFFRTIKLFEERKSPIASHHPPPPPPPPHSLPASLPVPALQTTPSPSSELYSKEDPSP